MSKCTFHIHGMHVYAYKGDRYVCDCGKVVEYDIMNRDFKEKRK